MGHGCSSKITDHSLSPRFRRTLKYDFTRRKYEDISFIRAFRKLRGDHPRPYEKRLLKRLLSIARSSRSTLGKSGRTALRLLDIGTGYGRDLAWLQARRGIHAVGMDYSLPMLRSGRKRLRLQPGSLVQMDACTLGFKTSVLDVVRAQAILHHMRPNQARRAVTEIARILRSGGLLQVFVREGTRCGFLREPGLGKRYFSYFTLRRLRALLMRCRFKLLEHERVVAAQGFYCLAVLARKIR